MIKTCTYQQLISVVDAIVDLFCFCTVTFLLRIAVAYAFNRSLLGKFRALMKCVTRSRVNILGWNMVNS